MITEKRIKLGHGSGGQLSTRLIKQTVLKYFKDKILKKLEDSASLTLQDKHVAFTTDSYVVNPIIFPGGDIGELAIYGTVNDLAMKGAVPKHISFSMIIEEDFLFRDLETILASAAAAARRAGVSIVCGDTKVVEKGKADKIFITTSGIGIIKTDVGSHRIRAGDRIIVSGTIGDHGIAIMNERLQLGLRSHIQSDCAPLNLITNRLLKFKTLHCMRDATRGGVASVLNEIIDVTNHGILLNEQAVPVRREVIGASELLGVDPFYIANEGKFIAVVDSRTAHTILKKIRSHPLGRHAAIIGEVVKKPRGVWVKTAVGGTHPLLKLEAEGLPRIC
jgi:hydrogenase expression/formation protein HypE